jgi:nitroreductase
MSDTLTLHEVKKPDTQAPLTDLLAKRWSPRAFAETPIAPEVLISLLEAARWSPSSSNEQPWRFIVGQKGDSTHEKLVDVLMEGNQGWAQHAPVLMLAVARMTRERNDKPNSHAWHDVGASLAHLTIQAAAHDIYVHQMGGYSADKATETFNIPAPFQPVTAVALGYLGDVDTLDDAKKESELAQRHRKPLSELVFTDTWGETNPLVE